MTTIVTFLLDRSGSMGSILHPTIEAFNAYTSSLSAADDLTFSLVQFDSQSIDTVFKNAAACAIPKLTTGNFQPRGGTPLIDACVKTIRAVERKVTEAPDAKVVICFQTDGLENASREHSWGELLDLIKEKTALGWQFNFMGAGIDAYQQASRMGLGRDQTMSYDAASEERTSAAFAASGMNTVAYAAGLRGSTQYSATQKRAAGDRYDPDLKKNPDAGIDLGAALAVMADVAVATAEALVDDPDL